MDNENNVPSTEEKVFTQADVDRIVQERVARVKNEEPSDYATYKKIGDALRRGGYEGTPEEIADVLERQLEESQQQINDLEQKKEDGGRLTQAEKELLKKASEFVEREEQKQKQSEKEKANEEFYNQQRDLLLEKHSVDAEELSKNAKFMKFVKGKTITDLVEVYEDFIDFIGESEAEVIKKVMSKQERSTSGGKGSNPDGKSTLTSEQRKTLDNWNASNPRMQMSEKEFLSRI